MTNLSPKAEPVTWSVLAAAFVAALASYGLNITNELSDLLVILAPFLPVILVRFAVFAPDTVEQEKQASYEQGVDDASNGTTLVI